MPHKNCLKERKSWRMASSPMQRPAPWMMWVKFLALIKTSCMNELYHFTSFKFLFAWEYIIRLFFLWQLWELISLLLLYMTPSKRMRKAHRCKNKCPKSHFPFQADQANEHKLHHKLVWLSQMVKISLICYIHLCHLYCGWNVIGTWLLMQRTKQATRWRNWTKILMNT